MHVTNQLFLKARTQYLSDQLSVSKYDSRTMYPLEWASCLWLLGCNTCLTPITNDWHPSHLFDTHHKRFLTMRRTRNCFKSKAVSCKVDRNTETVILQFFDRTGVILETPELFTKAYFTHHSIYAYLPLFIRSWIHARILERMMQEYWDSELFCFGDGRTCGMFPPLLCFCIKANGLATFFIASKNCMLWGASFEPLKKVASAFAQKLVTRF